MSLPLSKAAAVLGRRGGLSRSQAKSAASRRNGRRGGRPSYAGKMEAEYRNFPGWEIVFDGLKDLAAGRATPAALAVSFAAPRLERSGLALPRKRFQNADMKLFRQLEKASTSGLAHARFNAYLKSISEFAQAADRFG